MWRFGAYRERISFLSSIAGAFLSGIGIIVSLLVSSTHFSWWVWVPIAALFLLMALITIMVLRAETTTRVYQAYDESGIRNYLVRWIRNGGRVAIWTRDMSWAADPAMKEMLRLKAQSQELIICLPYETETTENLRTFGAEVIAYGALDSPLTSFTIANYGRAGSRVAIGRRKGNLHIIQEFSAEEHSAFDMARDLVTLVREQQFAGQRTAGG